MTGIDKFCTEYAGQLKRLVLENPADYPWYPSTPIATVVDRMTASFRRAAETGSCGFNKDSDGIRAASRYIGIKGKTYAALLAYFRSTVE